MDNPEPIRCPCSKSELMTYYDLNNDNINKFIFPDIKKILSTPCASLHLGHYNSLYQEYT